MSGVEQSLDCYLVGGAVRDELLGRPIHDRDWVVVGASQAQMLSLGFTQVGRDFPVFLHPQSHEEYALARTERKQGSGHTGFVVYAQADVTLEQDLERRDLTVNAIAKSVSGELVDPFGGLADIQNRQLRHVSAAFSEDPLRVFRVARFAAQLSGFEVAAPTMALMRSMNAAGELATLSAERVWQELEKSLGADGAVRFFDVLTQCGGLSDWFAELLDVPLVFQARTAQGRFAQLGLTRAGFETMSARVKVPRTYLQAALDCIAFADLFSDWRSAEPSVLVDALVEIKALHGDERLRWLLQWLEQTRAEGDYSTLLNFAQEMRAIRLKTDEVAGKAYGEMLRRERIEWLAQRLSASRLGEL